MVAIRMDAGVVNERVVLSPPLPGRKRRLTPYLAEALKGQRP
jgi:hypothetical protein